MLFRIRGSRRNLAKFAFIAGISGQANGNDLSLLARGGEYEINSLFHAKNNFLISASSQKTKRLGVGYGVKKNGLTVVVGGETDAISFSSHFVYVSYYPDSLVFGYDVRHDKERVTFGYSYKITDDFGYRITVDSQNKIGLGITKWIDY